jgi:MFS family permease
VTRVAAFRSRELTTKGVRIFQRAATADGADRSGLTSLTYAVMGNYAVDAALAVALANTLFFAAATAESTSKVLLYLLITVAPFAVIAPLIGPALDKLQHGRRIALAAASFARAVLAVVMAVNFDSWVLYPCALGMLVLSKSFNVLKAAVTPRVLPPDITLVNTNSRLTVFGLLAGGVAGALAAALSWAFGTTGALIFTAILSIVGGWLCLRIPAWVESTEGEVPVDGMRARARQAFPLSITTTLWANGSIRVETGFLALFIAFVIKSEYAESSGFTQLLLLGVVGVAAGLGGFLGNAIGARMPLTRPDLVSIGSLAAVVLTTLIAALIPGLITASIVGLVGSTASSLSKVCLDSVIQHELPEASRASAFGVSETALQLSWVFGGVVGLLIGGVWTFGHDRVYTIGFAVVTLLLAVGLTQSWLVRKGRSLFPWLHYAKLGGRFRKGRGAAAAQTTAQMPADPATGFHPQPGWSPPPASFGQPPWSTGPTSAGGPPSYSAGPYPSPASPGPAPSGYPRGGWSPSPTSSPSTSQRPTTPSSGQDPPPHRRTPRDAGSKRRRTRDS